MIPLKNLIIKSHHFFKCVKNNDRQKFSNLMNVNSWSIKTKVNNKNLNKDLSVLFNLVPDQNFIKKW